MSASLNEPTTSIAPLSAIASCRMRAYVDHYLVRSAHITGALWVIGQPMFLSCSNAACGAAIGPMLSRSPARPGLSHAN